MTTNIFFDPWIGSAYGTDASLFKNRILVLGASHYCESCDDCGDRDKYQACSNLTKNVIKDYLNPEHQGPWKKTYSTFINSMLGKSSTNEEQIDFFNSVVFYNYLQISAGEDPYSARQYDYSDPKYLNAFYEVLDMVLPEFVICWGNDVWNALPDNWNNCGEAKKGAEFLVGNQKYSKYQDYPYKNNTNITLLGVRHPSIGYGRDYHNEIFSKLILD